MRSERPSSRKYSHSHSAGGRSEVSESEADKKRNKLGYHRISIACAHCRRRKIRCVIEDEDLQQRCQTCIKLKKECVFYPVDQQGAADKITSKGSAKGGATTNRDTSSPSSTSRTYEGRDFGSFSSGQTVSSGTFQGLPIERSSSVTGSYPESEYEYRPANDAYLPRYPLHHSYSPTQPSAPIPASGSTYWKTGESRPLLDYAAFPSSTQSGAVVDMHAQRPIAGVGVGSRPETAWSSASAVDPSIHSFAYAPPAPTASGSHALAGRYPPTTVDVHASPMMNPSMSARTLPTAGPPVLGHMSPYMMTPQGAVTTNAGGYPAHHAYPSQWYPGSSYPSRTS